MAYCDAHPRAKNSHAKIKRTDSPAVKLAIDISILGAAENPHQRATVGIFRVIEHTARAPFGAPDCEVCFCAGQNRAAARRYFYRRLAPLDPSSGVRFAEPSLPGKLVAEAVTQMEDFIAKRYVRAPWRWFYSGRMLWRGLRRLLNEPEAAVLGGLDIYHAVGGGFPPWTQRQPKLRRVITVYDLMPLIHPEFFSPDSARHLHRILSGLTPGDWTLSISESTRRDLLRYYPACNPDRALVTPLAAESFFHPEPDAGKIAAARRRCGLPPDAPYFLSVSTLEPRKNFETIIRAFCDFLRAMPDSPARLALVGGVGWQGQQVSGFLAEQPGALRERVIFTGFVDDADLAALYSGALAFIYMSFYEGFGLPPLEAMQCGTPVISSNTSSLPEVVGEGGILLAPADRAGLTMAMGRLAQDETLRRRLAAAGSAQARRFSWERYQADVLAAYRRICGEQEPVALVSAR
jgi:glycosyltransferase involved in cell wall biosynthesis